MNEDINTSATPYCCVVSMRSNEKAIPGSTLRSRFWLRWVILPRKGCLLCKENQCSRGDNSVVPGVGPIAEIKWGTCTNVKGNARAERDEPMCYKPLDCGGSGGGGCRRFLICETDVVRRGICICYLGLGWVHGTCRVVLEVNTCPVNWVNLFSWEADWVRANVE